MQTPPVLSLPDALLLFALHDDQGTVQASAFLALDSTLRGAVLSELRLKGHVQTRTDGRLRHAPQPPAPPEEPVLARSLAALKGVDSVDRALIAIQHAVPEVRDDLVQGLIARGLLLEAVVARGEVVHPTGDPEIEARMREAVIDAVGHGEVVGARLGVLVALTVAAHLEDDVFPSARLRAQAAAMAAWVGERDSVVRAVREAVERVEGW